MIERVEYNGYASVYMHFDSNFGQVMYIKQVDSLVGWDQAPWRGKGKKNGEWSGLSKGQLEGKPQFSHFPTPYFFLHHASPQDF